VLVHDGNQDNGHRTSRARDLDVGAPEDGGDDAGDDCGDKSRLGAQAGGGTEGQGQGERDDRDGQTGHQVLSRVTSNGGEVGCCREKET
jgi:hypothetical protein